MNNLIVSINLCEIHDFRVLSYLIQEVISDEDTLAKCANTFEADFRICAAKSKHITEKIAMMLVDDPVPVVRIALASNSKVSRACLHILSRDPHKSVQLAVARNTKTASNDLDFLSKHEWRNVRIAVINNTATIASTLSSMHKDTDPGVLCALAKCRRTPVGALNALSLSKYMKTKGMLELVNNPYVSDHTLDYLAHIPNVYVQSAVASLGRTPKAVLSWLSSSDEIPVLEATAGNASTSSEDLDKLANCHDINVVVAVAGNTSASKSTLKRLSKCKFNLVSDLAEITLERKKNVEQ